MTTIKSYTNLQQSKKLAEILPLETADMWWPWYSDPVLNNGHYNDFPMFYKPVCNPDESIPCWSLAALRNLLPTAIKPNKDTYLFESHNTFDNSWVYRYYNEDDVSYLYYKDTNEVDACYEMIIRLHSKHLL